KQRLRVLQIERIEAFGEPVVDWLEQLACGVTLAVLDQQLGERLRTAQLPGSGLLPARPFDRRSKLRLGLCAPTLAHEHPTLEPQDFGDPHPLVPSRPLDLRSEERRVGKGCRARR